MTNEFNFRFGHGKKSKFSMLPVTNLNQAEEKAGIYAWFLPFPKSTDSSSLDAYLNFFQASKLDVNIKGHFGQRFRGEAIEVVRNLMCDDKVSSNLLFQATAALMPPIYVGISANVCNRLRTHYDSFQTALNLGFKKIEEQAWKEADSDSKSESHYFGQRLANSILESGFTDSRHLFVKIVYDDASTRVQLRNIEYAMNRLYQPILGRR